MDSCLLTFVIEADDLAAVVNAVGLRGYGVRDRDRRESPIGVTQESAANSGSVGDADDLTVVIDVSGDGRRATGSVDRGKHAVLQQEPVGSALGVHILADDLAMLVDAEGLGSHGIREIDLGEDAILQQEPMGQIESRRIALLAVGRKTRRCSPARAPMIGLRASSAGYCWTCRTRRNECSMRLLTSGPSSAFDTW